MISFKNKLKDKISKTGHSLCVGIDPHTKNLFPFLDSIIKLKGPRNFLTGFSKAHIDAAKGCCSTVKFQSAFFEQFGPAGFESLHESIAYAKANDLLVILDAKRCDISSTMTAYGTAAFEIFGADALTIIPYMGFDVISALESWLQKGFGIYVVLVSSNPTGEQLQSLRISSQSLAEYLFNYFVECLTKANLVDSTGFVIGATRLSILGSFLKNLATYPLLMPGVGAQGGSISEELYAVLKQSRSSLVPISRALSGLDSHPDTMNVSSWSDYSSFIRSRIFEFSKQLSLR